MNRINFKVLIAVFLVGFSLISCGKDKEDDEVTKSNHFLYEGKEHDLSRGIFDFYTEAEDTGSFGVDLALYSSGISYNSSDDEFSGTGNVIFFECYASTKNELNSGTYTFDITQSGKANSFDIGAVMVNVNVGDPDFELDLGQIITGGTFKVEKSGDIYELDIDCSLANGKKVTGYYKGKIDR